jgi:hypothetical protein
VPLMAECVAKYHSTIGALVFKPRADGFCRSSIAELFLGEGKLLEREVANSPAAEAKSPCANNR